MRKKPYHKDLQKDVLLFICQSGIDSTAMIEEKHFDVIHKMINKKVEKRFIKEANHPKELKTIKRYIQEQRQRFSVGQSIGYTYFPAGLLQKKFVKKKGEKSGCTPKAIADALILLEKKGFIKKRAVWSKKYKKKPLYYVYDVPIFDATFHRIFLFFKKRNMLDAFIRTHYFVKEGYIWAYIRMQERLFGEPSVSRFASSVGASLYNSKNILLGLLSSPTFLEILSDNVDKKELLKTKTIFDTLSQKHGLPYVESILFACSLVDITKCQLKTTYLDDFYKNVDAMLNKTGSPIIKKTKGGVRRRKK